MRHLSLALAVSLLFFSPACSTPETVPAEILLDSAGREYEWPSMLLYGRLKDGTTQEKQLLLDGICEHLNTADASPFGGYSRLVCVRAVTDLLRDDVKLASSTVLRAVSKHALRTHVNRQSATIAEIRTNAHDWYSRPLDVSWRVECDGLAVELEKTLPRGWTIGAVKVHFDGRPVSELPRNAGYPFGNSSVLIPIESLLTPGSEIGAHTWRIEYELMVADASVLLGTEWSFDIIN